MVNLTPEKLYAEVMTNATYFRVRRFKGGGPWKTAEFTDAERALRFAGNDVRSLIYARDDQNRWVLVPYEDRGKLAIH